MSRTMERDESFWADLSLLAEVDHEIQSDERITIRNKMRGITDRMLVRLRVRITSHAFDLLDAAILAMLFSYWKGLAYRDSWQKHGEIVSIFANVSRKYDRLEEVFTGDGGLVPGMETVNETVVDLLTYALKWTAWIPMQGGRADEFLDYLDKARREFGCEVKGSD